MSAQQANNKILVAVPYYGSLSLPPLGLSRLFFFVELAAETRKARRIDMEVWDPKQEPNLAAWLRTQGVAGVICSDSASHYRSALESERIWLVGEQEGEAAELVERWALGALEHGKSWRMGAELNPWCAPQSDRAAIAA